MKLKGIPFKDIKPGDRILFLEEDKQTYNTTLRLVTNIIDDRVYYYFPDDQDQKDFKLSHYIPKYKITNNTIAIINKETHPEYFL